MDASPPMDAPALDSGAPDVSIGPDESLFVDYVPSGPVEELDGVVQAHSVADIRQFCCPLVPTLSGPV